MSKNKYSHFVNSSKELSKKKRVEKRQNNAKEYQNGVMKTTHGSTDQAYIRGDIRTVAKNKVYGHKKDLAEGGQGRLNKDAIRNPKKYEVKRNYAEPKKKKYNWIDSTDTESVGFKNKLNTVDGNGKLRWDGLDLAKQNQRKGKHIKNIGHLGAGLFKDVVADPVFDALRGFDRVESAVMGGVLGGVDHATNAFKSASDSTAKFKDYMTKDVIKNNVKASLDESDKTGWGRASGETLKEMQERDYQKEIDFHKRSGNDFMVENMETVRANRNENQHEISSMLAGLVFDITSPVSVGTTLSKAFRGLGSETLKQGKNILKGTSEVAPVGLVPEEVSKVMTATDNAIVTGKSKLDGFLQQFSPRNIKSKNADEIFDMPTNDYDKYLSMQSDEFFNAVDDLPDLEQDKIYDYVAKKDPELFKALTYESDEIDAFTKIEDGVDNLTPTITKKKTGIKTSQEANQKLNEFYKQIEAKRIQQSLKPQQALKKRAPLSTNHKNYDSGVFNFIEKTLPNLDEKTVETYKNVFDKTRNINNNVDRDKVVKFLNKYVFNGNDVIRNNVSARSLSQFTDYLGDAIRYTEAKNIGAPKYGKYNATTKALDELNVADGFDMKGRNTYGLSLTDDLFENKLDLKNSVLGTKNKSEIIDPLDELYNIKKERPLTQDEYKKFKDLNARKDLWNRIHEETRYLDEVEYEKYLQKHYPNKSINTKYNSALDEMAEGAKSKKLTYEEFVANEMSSLTAKDRMLSEKQLKGEIDARYEDYKNELGSEKILNQIRNQEATKKVERDSTILSQSPRAEQEMLNGVGELTENIKKVTQNLRKNLNLPETKTNKVKIKLTKNQKLKDLPPVKDNLKYLRSAIEQEVDMMYRNPTQYKELESSFKEIKKGYVNSLRSLGISDDKYFHKVKALQDDLKLYFDELNKTTKPKDTPLMRMELQKLAKRIETTFDEVDDIVLKVDDIDKTSLDDVISMEGAMNGNFKTNDGYIPNKIENTPLEQIGKVNVDQDTQINMLGYITGDGIDVSKKPFLSKKKKQKTNELPKLEFGGKYYDDIDKLSSIDERLANRLTPERMSEILGEDIGDVLKYADKPSKYAKKASNNAPESILRGSDEVDELSITKEIEELRKAGIDATTQPPKEKPKNMNPNIYKRWLNTWKKGVTAYNPGWHMANFFQNKGQNYLALGADAFMPQTKAKKILKTMNGKSTDEFIRLGKNGQMHVDDLAKMAQELGVAEGLSNDVIKSQGLFPKLETKVDNSGLNKWLSKSENTARLNHWVKQMERGMSPEQAQKSVNKYLFDYSDKGGKGHQFMGDYIDPFWTFHRNNARLMMESAVKNPSEFGNIQRGLRNLENVNIKEGQEQKETSKYRDYQMPGASFYDPTNDGQYNYLYDQSVLPDFDGAIPSNRDEIEQKLNPIIRLALQQSRGEGNFGNKIVEKGEEADWGEVTQKERLGEVVAELNPVLPLLFNTMNKTHNRQKKADEGKVSQDTTDKQKFHDWMQYITGHKGNWYRNI